MLSDSFVAKTAVRWAAAVAVATIVPLSLRESLLVEDWALGLIGAVGIVAALTLRIPPVAFLFISLIFPTPLWIFHSLDIEFRLTHAIALVLIGVSTIDMLREKRLLRNRGLGFSLLWIGALAASAVVPFLADERWAALRGIAAIQIDFSLVFVSALLGFANLKQPGLGEILSETARGLSVVFLFWFTLVQIIVPAGLGHHFSFRKSHFLFPLDDSHIVTGIFSLVILLLTLQVTASRQI